MAQSNTAGTRTAANHAAPAQPPSKSQTATPKLNNEMEMGTLPGDAAQNDIMQMARIGDIGGMEKLFEAGEFDATYTDEEGITPLHVGCLLNCKARLGLEADTSPFCSGPPLTTSMQCANS
jgi:hypothetical protein